MTDRSKKGKPSKMRMDDTANGDSEQGCKHYPFCVKWSTYLKNTPNTGGCRKWNVDGMPKCGCTAKVDTQNRYVHDCKASRSFKAAFHGMRKEKICKISIIKV